MRTRTVLAVAAALVVLPVSAAVGHPAQRSTTVNCIGDGSGPSTPGGHELASIEFSDQKTGWAAGGGQVLRTTDGGAHWAVVYRDGGADISQIDAFNDRDVWAVNGGSILRTADGGHTWHSLRGVCPLISSVDFFSPRNGIAVAGKTLLQTTDGGRLWAPLSAPRNVQSACFSDALHGWAGAHGQIYRTVDGGQHWRLSVSGPRFRKAERNITDALVQCAGPRAGWGELDIAGAAMNQSPHVGYHLSAAGSRPVFSEGYFPYPGLPRLPQSPGSEPSTFSAISPTEAAYVDFCGPCGYGEALVGVVTDGDHVGHSHRVRHIVSANGAAFLSATNGWVVGSTSVVSKHPHWRIEHTTDGGKTWTTQYQS